MPTAYILVGVPGSGKSTWARNQQWAKQCKFISTDDLVEAYALSCGKTYTEVFKDYMPEAVKVMADQVVQAWENGDDIIWDQTSTTIASRKKKFAMLPGYTMIAVVFKTPGEEELNARLMSRPGKVIPLEAIQGMISGFEHPSLEEGFDQVWHA